VKKLVVIFSVVSFVAVLGVGSAMSSDLLTGCFNPDKKDAKLKHVAAGTEPAKPCKSGHTQISLATDEAVDTLLDDIGEVQTEVEVLGTGVEANFEHLENVDSLVSQNTSAIEENSHDIGELTEGVEANFENLENVDNLIDVLESAVAENSHDIGELTEGVEANFENLENVDNFIDALEISSMVGGSLDQSLGEGPHYGPMFHSDSSAVEREVESKLAAMGSITKLAVMLGDSLEPPFEVTYTLRHNGGNTNLTCNVVGSLDLATQMCTVEGCAQYAMGDTLSLKAEVDHDEILIPKTLWTARFVENGECPIVIPWCDTVHCEEPTPFFVGCANGDPINEPGLLVCESQQD